MKKDRIIHSVLAVICLGAILFTLALRTVWYDTAEVMPLESTEAGQLTGHATHLVLYYHEQRPYYMSYKGDVQGLVADNVTLAMNNAGIDFTWEEVPTARQLPLIKENTLRSCAVGWIKNAEQEEYAKLTRAVYQDKPHVVVTRADNELLTSGISLEGLLASWQLRLLVKSNVSSTPFGELVLKDKKVSMISTTTDNYSMLKMIRNHRADYCFMPEEEVADLLLFSNLNKAEFKIVHINDIPRGNYRYLLCSKKVEDDIIDRLNTAIETTVFKPVN